MSLIRILMVLCLFVTAACSDKSQKPVSTQPAPAQESAPQSDSKEPTEAEATPTYDTEPPPKVTENHVDTYAALVIQNIKEQIANDPLSNQNKILNVEFANRIYKVNFTEGKSPQLSFVTHTAKAFKFILTNSNGNTQYMNSFKSKGILLDSTKRVSLYAAEVKKIRSTKNISLYTIKIKDIESNAIVHVVYVRKNGTVQYKYLPGYDYSRDLSKTSKVFLQKLKEDNSVEGEFYGVITEDDNISNASRFTLTISDNFIMESLPLTAQSSQTRTLPLIVDYKSFWKQFFFGSIAYKVISDSVYKIESLRNPVELSALNLGIRVEGGERIEGKKNSLPINLFINFK